jgi:predicted glycosyltransferase
MGSLPATADVVISLGGYNTLTEAIAAGCRVLVMPRTWTSATQALEAGQTNLSISESEQLFRIELFGQLGLIEVVEPVAGPDEIAATSSARFGRGRRNHASSRSTAPLAPPVSWLSCLARH